MTANPANTNAAPPNAIKGRVLVVDDIEENREIMKYYLVKAGYEVTTTDDGFTALQGLVGGATQRRAGTKPPEFDLVLMDMSMPLINGYEAVRRLRSQGYTKPVVAVTANTLVGDREKCLEAGCDDYVGKPFEPAQLLDVCARMLVRAKTATAAAA
jgi:CheY-like chemotaxis protein